MLKQLDFSYIQYAILISLPFISRIVICNYVEKLAERFGVHRIWSIGLILIAPLPVLWIYFSDYWHLLLIQLLGGAAWGLAEYGQTLTLIYRFPRNRRSTVLTIANIVNAMGMGLGFLLGTCLWWVLDPSQQYTAIMAVSSVLRLAACGMIPFVVVRSPAVQRMFYRWIGLRPGAGGIARPVLYAAEKKDSQKKEH